ncbi:FecCD family ABC transporter permease [Athalassotoga saccharophila]|uniref:FecCD family ABC transporter permease n=1 Tax=Athalassotoga saccharophila TaxID=1441386 RepID=UPI00137ADD3E|nr:iron ABC transporter permease [Athalassotoga saccharophila]BBJ28588.1 hemin transport system permease protein HmuU [Athalassotoga saccharophila]
MVRFSKSRVFFLTLPFILAFVLVNIAIGPVYVPIVDVFKSLIGMKVPYTDKIIILQLRLPRVLLGLGVGAALSVTGNAFQAMLKNPLADPYILGVSSGAAFGAILANVIAQLYYPYFVFYMWIFAFVFGLLATAITYFVSRRHGKLPPTELILSGVIVNLMFGAGVTFLIVYGWRDVQITSFWLLGSLSGAGWHDVLLVGISSTAAVVFFTAISKYLNAMVAGEEEALYLGVNVEMMKLLIFVIGTLITAIAVSTSGIIGFVGLIIPHISRRLFGSDHRISTPASAIFGGVFLVACDTVARSAFTPAEMPIGTITALIGAPIFIYILRRRVQNV